MDLNIVFVTMNRLDGDEYSLIAVIGPGAKPNNVNRLISWDHAIGSAREAKINPLNIDWGQGTEAWCFSEWGERPKAMKN